MLEYRGNCYTLEIMNIIFGNALSDLFPDKNTSQDIVFIKLVFGLIIALMLAYLINKGLNFVINLTANLIAEKNHGESPHERLIQTKRAETLLSISGGIARALVIGFCVYIMWRIVNPTSAPVAIIGASTFFIVLGAATIGPMLRDITSGIVMITEKWYNVGDHVVVDPFWEMSGIVEKVNLRSTKIRSLNGEVVWIHNQNIHAVRVTPKGLRTLSVDTFVHNLEEGRKLILDVIKTMPVGPTMIATSLKIDEEEQLGNVWRITIEGQTTPGREWLIEDFAVKALLKADEENKKDPIIAHGPIVRYTDTTAEKRFETSMRTRNDR